MQIDNQILRINRPLTNYAEVPFLDGSLPSLEQVSHRIRCNWLNDLYIPNVKLLPMACSTESVLMI